MNEFILIFRNEQRVDAQLTPEQMKDISKPWQDWMGSIAAQNKLADMGNRLSLVGATVYPDLVVTDGPYAEIKEIIAGYTMVKTETLQEAIELAKTCPNLARGGTVEVRAVVQMNK